MTSKIIPIPGFSEPVSSLTHLIGAGVFAGLSFFLLRKGRGDSGRVFALGVFASSAVFLLAMSGVYHLLAPDGAGRVVLQRLDHDAIFVLIAGTFTPAHAILFKGRERWVPLCLIWAVAAAGITLKTIFFSSIAEWQGQAFYLAMGWLGTASAFMIWRRYGSSLVRPLFLGGVAYTVGVLMEFLRWPVLVPGVFESHELFHLAVLAGLGFHWQFVLRFAAGAPKVGVPP
jgi:channel protein (hemolysin III family)